jgi:hypothetical protein
MRAMIFSTSYKDSTALILSLVSLFMPAIILLEQSSDQFLFGHSLTIASMIVWTCASKLMALHHAHGLLYFCFLMTTVQVVSGKNVCFVPEKTMFSVIVSSGATARVLNCCRDGMRW